MPSPGNDPTPPHRIVIGEYCDRTTVEEVCQLLGHDDTDVYRIVLTYNSVIVDEYERIDGQPLGYVTYHHVVR